MSISINGKEFTTFSDYINDESRVSKTERAQAELEAALAMVLIEARRAKGLSRKELAEISGVKKATIKKLEAIKGNPRLDTLIKILVPLGYTLSVAPIEQENKEKDC